MGRDLGLFEAINPRTEKLVGLETQHRIQAEAVVVAAVVRIQDTDIGQSEEIVAEVDGEIIGDGEFHTRTKRVTDPVVIGVEIIIADACDSHFGAAQAETAFTVETDGNGVAELEHAAIEQHGGKVVGLGFSAEIVVIVTGDKSVDAEEGIDDHPFSEQTEFQVGTDQIVVVVFTVGWREVVDATANL